MPLTYMNMKKIVLSLFALAALNCSAQSVSQRLERLFDADQQIRKTETVDSLIEAQDSVNRAVLKEFIADYNPDSCSVKANQGLYLVLSHSPLAFRLPMAHLIDQAWQKKRLDAFYCLLPRRHTIRSARTANLWYTIHGDEWENVSLACCRR